MIIDIADFEHVIGQYLQKQPISGDLRGADLRDIDFCERAVEAMAQKAEQVTDGRQTIRLLDPDIVRHPYENRLYIVIGDRMLPKFVTGLPQHVAVVEIKAALNNDIFRVPELASVGEVLEQRSQRRVDRRRHELRQAGQEYVDGLKERIREQIEDLLL